MTNSAPGLDLARRAVFLDFDGTYAFHSVVPTAHADAVAAVQSQGHLVFLCTGRPLSLLPDDVMATGFDGFVATAGSYVEFAGQPLLDQRFPTDVAVRAYQYLDAHDAMYIVETPSATFLRPEVFDTMKDLALRADDQVAAGSVYGILEAVTVQEDLSAVRPSKITVFSGSAPLRDVARLIGPEVDIVGASLGDHGEGAGAGEMFLTGISKATGIAQVLQHLDLTAQDVVAVGDGPNDLEMLEFAGTAVAIEGSSPQLVALADMVAAGPEHAGLVQVFVALGLMPAP